MFQLVVSLHKLMHSNSKFEFYFFFQAMQVVEHENKLKERVQEFEHQSVILKLKVPFIFTLQFWLFSFNIALQVIKIILHNFHFENSDKPCGHSFYLSQPLDILELGTTKTQNRG